jgi:hypothetical protein
MRRWIGSVGVTAAAVAALALPLRASLAWGPEAHRAIALIAERQSDPAVRAKILAILATDKGKGLTKNDIAGEATWADVLREKSEEARSATGAWHATRFKPDNPDLALACYGRTPLPAGYPASHGPRENCSIDKIEQFASELKNPETSPGERLTALQFLLNLVGDLNDPLLAIDRGDQGGECVALQIGAAPPVRLSSYWQETLVGEVVGPDPAKGAARIVASVPAAEAQKWADGNPETWARDTFEVAKSVAYSFAAGQPEGKQSFPARPGQAESCAAADVYRVGPDYETKALAAVRQQLAKAGLRLARVLRDDFK